MEAIKFVSPNLKLGSDILIAGPIHLWCLLFDPVVTSHDQKSEIKHWIDKGKLCGSIFETEIKKKKDEVRKISFQKTFRKSKVSVTYWFSLFSDEAR